MQKKNRFVVTVADDPNHIEGVHDYSSHGILSIPKGKLRAEVKMFDDEQTVLVYKLVLVEKWKNGKRLLPKES